MFSNFIRQGNFIYFALYAVAVIFTTYFYAMLVYKPKKILEISQKYGFSLKSSEKDKKAYLDANMTFLLGIAAGLLIIMPEISRIFNIVLRANDGFVMLLSGLSILVLAGIFFDIVSQVEFHYKKKISKKDFKIAYVEIGEIEAKIESEYLKNDGIDALVEPLRYTWGMPIRTAFDQYRIYVPADKVVEARELIG